VFVQIALFRFSLIERTSSGSNSRRVVSYLETHVEILNGLAVPVGPSSEFARLTKSWV
jgi:hypothetical protein